jgi:hypothetical protein
MGGVFRDGSTMRQLSSLEMRAGHRGQMVTTRAIGELPFQIDHIVAAQDGRICIEDNLAWVCARCMRRLRCCSRETVSGMGGNQE